MLRECQGKAKNKTQSWNYRNTVVYGIEKARDRYGKNNKKIGGNPSIYMYAYDDIYSI